MKYTVIEKQLVYQIWLYEVDADSEDEAIEMVKSGEVALEDDMYSIDNSYSSEYEYVINGKDNE